MARGPRDMAVLDVDPPVLPPGGVVVEVEAAGVCAADRMLWTGDHPWGPLPWPFTPGHELLGLVVETDTAHWSVGDRVTAEVMLPCGACTYCKVGRDNLCPAGLHLGSGIPGAFAERLALPASARLHAIPPELARDVAVLAEPMACALHAVRRGRVDVGDTVAVVGLGSVGALALHAARSEGADTVFAVTRSAVKARLARELGADAPVADPDVVVECSGTAAGVSAALELVAPGGRVVLYGVYPRPVTVDANLVAEFKELTLAGGHLAPGQFPDAVALLATVPTGIVTGVHELDQLTAALAPAGAAPRLKEIIVP